MHGVAHSTFFRKPLDRRGGLGTPPSRRVCERYAARVQSILAHPRRLLVVVVVALGAGGCRGAARCCHAVPAGCRPPAAPAALPQAQQPPIGPQLPTGCEILTRGSRPCLSPGGARMAFVRWAELGEGTTRFSGPYRPGDRLDAVPQVWLRDMATGAEGRLPDWRPEGDDGVIRTDRMRLPMSWPDEQTLLLDDGALVDATTGAVRTSSIEIPKSAQPASLAWSRDGKRAVCIAEGRVRDDAYRSVESTVFLLEPGREPRPVVLGNGALGQHLDWEREGMNLQKGVFEWTSDGQRIRFCLQFHQYGGPSYWKRTGLLELDGTARVLATSVDSGGWPRSTWSADGARGAFVLERGGAQSDLFVTNADGSDVARATDDHALKGILAIDPAGRRVAYLTGQTDERGRVPKPVLRVLDLASGRARDLVLPSPDDPPSRLLWLPRGDRLLYDGRGKIYLHAVEPEPMPSEDGALIRIPYARNGLLLEALASGGDAEVQWATHLVAQEWDPALVPALRAALRARIEARSFDWTIGADLLRLLFDRDVREALPEMRLAAGPDSPLDGVAAWMIATWMGKDALPELDALRTKGDGYGRFAAAAAMAGLGDERGWETLVAALKGPHPPVVLLASLRDPRCVDLLIGLLADEGRGQFAAWSSVGDAAERALAALTGKTFARDKAKWTDWWTNVATRVLPDVKPDNPAVLEVDRTAEERRKKSFGEK